jgi:hypothetical protein
MIYNVNNGKGQPQLSKSKFIEKDHSLKQAKI